MNKLKQFLFYLICFGVVFNLCGFFVLGWQQGSSVIVMIITSVVFALAMTAWTQKRVS